MLYEVITTGRGPIKANKVGVVVAGHSSVLAGMEGAFHVRVSCSLSYNFV